MYDQILFALTSMVSLIASIVIIARLARSGGLPRALWAISFAILCVATAAVAIYGLGVLSQPLVNLVASLIPGFIATGLLLSWRRRIGSIYLRYIIVAFFFLLVVTFAFNAPSVLSVVFVHFPSGLIIFLLPLYTVLTRSTRWSGVMVGIGGLLIGIGGMGLATLTAGVPILPAETVLDLLAPIFFAMTLLFALGILATPGWGRPR